MKQSGGPASDHTFSEVTLRPYVSDDLEACREIAGASTDYAHVVDENADAMEVATHNQAVIGFSFIQVWSWNQIAWLGDIVVASDWRGRGVGQALLRKMEERALEAGCRVIMDHPPSNHPVLTFYLSQGYRICGYNDSFFPGKDQTALFVAKSLLADDART